MKLLKLFSGSLFLYFLFFSTGTQLVSCTPESIFDTVYVKDTLTIRDTLTVKDTVDCNCYDLTKGLVAWYNFKGGNLNDSSGNNNHITFNNAVTTTGRNGKANGAYLFNGTNSYMHVPNSASLNPTQSITLSAVVKLNGFNQATCHGNQIFGKIAGNDYANGYYNMRISDHQCTAPINTAAMKFSGAFGNNYGYAPWARTDTVFASLGKWYHIVYTFENGTARLYLNGDLKDSRTEIPFAFTPNTYGVNIGKADIPQYPYWLNGVIDDIRIYDRALGDGEVKQLNRVID